jgi:hypothetical protein
MAQIVGPEFKPQYHKKKKNQTQPTKQKKKNYFEGEAKAGRPFKPRSLRLAWTTQQDPVS